MLWTKNVSHTHNGDVLGDGPRSFFFSMVDISRVNTFVLFRAANPTHKMTDITFTVTLGKSWIQNHLKSRSLINTLPSYE